MVVIKDVSAIPKMTSNTAPFGVVSASSEFSTSYQAWIVFGQTAKNAYWSSKYREGSSWLSYEFPQAKRIIRYSILMESGVAYAPFNWTFEGFDEASGTWIVLDTRTEVSFVINIKQLYDFNNDVFFKKYRINISKGSNTDYTYISKMEMFEPLPEKRAILQNPTTNQHYSLSDNTLIHLPDSTIESIIEHGVEQRRYIQLDTPFTKQRYFNDTPVASVNGKVFTHDIGKINTLSIKELREEGVVSIVLPIDVWYETNMTSNTAPTPLVASASSTYTSFTPYKAFNGTRGTTGNDSWMTSNSRTGWIQIDFGKGVIANRVNISIVSNLTAAPKNFNILGSKDGVNFVILGAFTNQTNWTANELREYSFNNNEKFSYYKVEILENNGHGTDVSIGEIQYGFKREEI